MYFEIEIEILNIKYKSTTVLSGGIPQTLHELHTVYNTIFIISFMVLLVSQLLIEILKYNSFRNLKRF